MSEPIDRPNGETDLRTFLVERLDRIEAELARLAERQARMAERQDALIKDVTIVRLAVDVIHGEVTKRQDEQDRKIAELSARLQKLEA